MLFLTAAVVVLALSLVVLLATQVELFRDIRQLREVTGLLDQPTPLDLGSMRGEPLEAIGIPPLPGGKGVILILSDKCSTCRALAEALDGKMPADVQVVLSNPGGRQSELPLAWVLDRAIEDEDAQITKALDINITPAAIVIDGGRLVSAQTIPSSRQLFSLLEQNRAGQMKAPESGRNWSR